jgi:hypothetical protein
MDSRSRISDDAVRQTMRSRGRTIAEWGASFFFPRRSKYPAYRGTSTHQILIVMRTDLEQASRTRGIVVSALLHALFIAGCLALDAGGFQDRSNPSEDHARVQPVDLPQGQATAKS